MDEFIEPKFPSYAIVHLVHHDLSEIPGIKVRGIEQDLDEAKKIAKRINKSFPNNKCVILKQQIAHNGGYFYDVSHPLNVDDV